MRRNNIRNSQEVNTKMRLESSVPLNFSDPAREKSSVVGRARVVCE